MEFDKITNRNITANFGREFLKFGHLYFDFYTKLQNFYFYTQKTEKTNKIETKKYVEYQYIVQMNLVLSHCQYCDSSVLELKLSHKKVIIRLAFKNL